jgi:hypothetical protein
MRRREEPWAVVCLQLLRTGGGGCERELCSLCLLACCLLLSDARRWYSHGACGPHAHAFCVCIRCIPIGFPNAFCISIQKTTTYPRMMDNLSYTTMYFNYSCWIVLHRGLEDFRYMATASLRLSAACINLGQNYVLRFSEYPSSLCIFATM